MDKNENIKTDKKINYSIVSMNNKFIDIKNYINVDYDESPYTTKQVYISSRYNL